MATYPSSAPSISVVMPVRNGGEFLRPAIHSILNQTFTDFEFVIVDDGSTDETPSVLRDYAASDQRISVLKGSGQGIVAALNTGLNEAQGELIARMDADDIACERRLELQHEHLRLNLNCVAVGSRILLIDTEGWPIRTMCDEKTHEEIDEANLRGGGAAMNHPAVTFRMAAFKAVGGYRQEMIYAEDLDLWLRMAEIGRLYNLPQVLTHYRMHAKSIGHARAQEQRRQWRKAATEALRRRGVGSEPAAIPESGPESIADHHARWAWWALMAGNVRTARKHALAVLRRTPLSIQSWRLAACAVRGH